MYYSSTHFLILFFLINTFPPPPPPHFGWLVLHSFSSYFLSCLYFRSVWHPFRTLFHPTHGFLVLFCVTFTFSIMFIPHCKYFFPSSCTRKLAHNAVNTCSQSLLHQTCMSTSPVQQMPFVVTTLKIEDWKQLIKPMLFTSVQPTMTNLHSQLLMSRTGQ